MKQKNLFRFGTLLIIALPAMTIISCSSDHHNPQADLTKQLAKVKEQYSSLFSVQGIKDHIENIADNGEVDLASIGVAKAQFDQVDEGWTLKYYLDGKASSYLDNDLMLKAKVTKNDDSSITKEKDVSIKPLAQDSEKPIIEAKNKITIAGVEKTIAWINKAATLTIAPNASLNKASFEALFSVSDNSGEKITPDFTWKDGDQDWTGADFSTEGTYTLVVKAQDNANQQADQYTLTVQVSSIQVEINKINSNPQATISKENLNNMLKDKAKNTIINENDWKALGLTINKNLAFDYELKVSEPWNKQLNKVVLTLKISRKDQVIPNSLSQDITITGVTTKMWDNQAKVANQIITVDSQDPQKASVTLSTNQAPEKDAIEAQIKEALDNNQDDSTIITWKPEYNQATGDYVVTLITDQEKFTFTVTIEQGLNLRWNNKASVGGKTITIDNQDSKKASVSLAINQAPEKDVVEAQIKEAIVDKIKTPSLTWGNPEYAKTFGTYVATLIVDGQTFTFTIDISITP